MQTYLINLDRSPERLRFMAGRLKARGIAYRRIAAIDGRQLTPEDIEAVVRRVPGAPAPSTGEIGCFLSHRMCWREIVDSGEPYGCVLEDDIELSLRLNEFLADPDWIPGDAEIIKIETLREKVWLDRRHIPLRHGFSLTRLRSTHYGCAGYIVSSAAARRLLEVTRQFSDPVDLVVFNPDGGFASQFATYQFVPALCIQTQLRHRPDSPHFMPSTLRADRSKSRFPSINRLPKLRRELVHSAIKVGHWLSNRYRTRVIFEQLPEAGIAEPPR